MNCGIATDGSRLFVPFFDEVDMIAFFAADATLGEVNREASAHGLHYPLGLDPEATLREHFAAAEYAPSSARFGACVDNVPGMNWLLPSGTSVRIGERVVKSTTGYDLLRFLLHSGGRFGRASAYVLRLRPLHAETASAVVTGPPEALDRCRLALLHSPWLHWIDRLELSAGGTAGERLELESGCLPGETKAFQDFFATAAAQSGCQCVAREPLPPPGLPAATLKTTPGHAVSALRRLAAASPESSREIRALCVPGVVLLPPLDTLDAALLATLAEEATRNGGHIFGRDLPPVPQNPAEVPWTNHLFEQWRNL